jgi:hypothetical protein
VIGELILLLLRRRSAPRFRFQAGLSTRYALSCTGVVLVSLADGSVAQLDLFGAVLKTIEIRRLLRSRQDAGEIQETNPVSGIEPFAAELRTMRVTVFATVALCVESFFHCQVCNRLFLSNRRTIQTSDLF